MAGSSLTYCSPACESRAKRRRRLARDEVYQRGRSLDPQVIDRLVQRQPFAVCRRCRKPFVRAAQGRPALYCSRQCRQAAYWRRHHRPVLRRAVCDGCGQSFDVTVHNQKYCSKRCCVLVNSRRRRGRRFWDYCQFCGVNLPRVYKYGPAPKFCSALCRERAYRLARKGRPNRPTHCWQCGAALPPPDPSKSAVRRYCSQRCKSRAEYLRRLAARPDLPIPLPLRLG